MSNNQEFNSFMESLRITDPEEYAVVINGINGVTKRVAETAFENGFQSGAEYIENNPQDNDIDAEGWRQAKLYVRENGSGDNE